MRLYISPMAIEHFKDALYCLFMGLFRPAGYSPRHWWIKTAKYHTVYAMSYLLDNLRRV